MGIIVTEELLETIDNYLKKDLSEKECSNFEKLINENKELEEIILIQKKLFELNNFDTNNIVRNLQFNEDYNYYKQLLTKEENQQIYAKIREIGRKKNYVINGNKRAYLKYCIAASIAVFLSVIFILTSNSSMENYYYDNVNWQDLPSFVSKEQSLNDFTKGEILFKNEKFEKAILTFSCIKPDNELYPYTLMYIGASYDKLNKNDEALLVFDKLSKLPNFDGYSRGYWYKLLIYLKEDNRDKAIEIKSIILKNNFNFNYEKAKNIKL
jgi:hypothetical protein